MSERFPIKSWSWVFSLAFALSTAACTGENQQAPVPIDLTEAGAFVAAVDDDGHTFLLNRVLRAERFPDDIETVLHLTIYQEQASTIEEATALAKRPVLYVRFPHIAVLQRDFIQRRYAVVWFRTLTPEEESYLQQ